MEFCRVGYEDEIVSLTIEQSTPDDEGEYTVKAINEKGVATSSAEVLVHLEGPIFTRPLSDVAVEFKDTAIFECEVTGIPKPKVSWLIEDLPLDEEDKRYMTRYQDNKAVLEIKDISEEDSPVFVTCKAENTAGETRTTAELVIQGIFL